MVLEKLKEKLETAIKSIRERKELTKSKTKENTASAE